MGSFGDRLAERVAEIRRAAIDAYDEWLRLATMQDLRISGDGTRVEPHAGTLTTGDALDYHQSTFEEFLVGVDALAERFAKYYPLDLNPVSAVRSPLSRSDTTALGDGWEGPGAVEYERWPTKVVDRIDYAAALVLQTSEPRDKIAEDGIWRGTAADSFNDYFLDPFKQIAARQIFCGVYLACVADVFVNATRRTQHNLEAIADFCVAALRGDDTRPLSEQLSFLSLATSIVGLIVPEPISTTAGVTSIALSLWATLAVGVTDDQRSWVIERGGPHPRSTIDSTMDVLTRLEEQLTEEDGELSVALDKDLDTYFYSMDFDARPGNQDPPERMSEDLAANIQTIYENGAYYLPSAANQYGEAHRVLKECVIPSWFGELILPRSRLKFNSARNGLAPDLLSSRDRLVEVGEALVTICEEYASQDAAAGAELERLIEEGLEPPQPAQVGPTTESEPWDVVVPRWLF